MICVLGHDFDMIFCRRTSNAPWLCCQQPLLSCHRMDLSRRPIVTWTISEVDRGRADCHERTRSRVTLPLPCPVAYRNWRTAGSAARESSKV
jgi:hypothetical protein